MSDDTASRNTATLSTGPAGTATCAMPVGDATCQFIHTVFEADPTAVNWTRADITWANAAITWETLTYEAA